MLGAANHLGCAKGRVCSRPGTAGHRMWMPIIQVAESLMGWIHV